MVKPYDGPEILFTRTALIPDPVFLSRSRTSLSPRGQALLAAWEQDAYAALFALGLQDSAGVLPPALAYLHQVARAFFHTLLRLPGLEATRECTALPKLFDRGAASTFIDRLFTKQLYALLEQLPYLPGAAIVNVHWLYDLYAQLLQVFSREIRREGGTVAQFFARWGISIPLHGRLCFALSETYPHKLSALYLDGSGQQATLLSYPEEIPPDQTHPAHALFAQAVALAPALRTLSDMSIDSDPDTYYDAICALEQLQPELEDHGFWCYIPDSLRWTDMPDALSLQLPPDIPVLGWDTEFRPAWTVSYRAVHVASRGLEGMKGLGGLDGIELSMEPSVEDLQNLTRQPPDMSPVLQNLPAHTSLRSLFQLIPSLEDEESIPSAFTLSRRDLLRKLTQQQELSAQGLSARLSWRPTPSQIESIQRLWQMHHLGLGLCLADSPGLDKTGPVMGYLELLRQEQPNGRALLIVPDALLSHYRQARDQLCPRMPLFILYGRPARTMAEELASNRSFLTLTAYSVVAKIETVLQIHWTTVILEEVQAIQSAGTRQAHTIKKLDADMHVALTSEPVSCQTDRLWAIADFLHRGIMGTQSQFKRYVRNLYQNPSQLHRLRDVFGSFVLQHTWQQVQQSDGSAAIRPLRLYANLEKRQRGAYREALSELDAWHSATPSQRTALVQHTIQQLQQICDHPDLLCEGGSFAEKDSGKFALLHILAMSISQYQEHCLVISQFPALLQPLRKLLETVFHRPGVVLDAHTSVDMRHHLAEEFASTPDEACFMVLSLDALCPTLQLSAFEHVICLDFRADLLRPFRSSLAAHMVLYELCCHNTLEARINSPASTQQPADFPWQDYDKLLALLAWS